MKPTYLVKGDMWFVAANCSGSFLSSKRPLIDASGK